MMSGNTAWRAIKHTSKKQGYNVGLLLHILSGAGLYTGVCLCREKSALSHPG